MIINLAVGGTIGYYPDGLAGKPWSDSSPEYQPNSMITRTNGSRHGPQSTLKIDSVKV